MACPFRIAFLSATQHCLSVLINIQVQLYGLLRGMQMPSLDNRWFEINARVGGLQLRLLKTQPTTPSRVACDLLPQLSQTDSTLLMNECCSLFLIIKNLRMVQQKGTRGPNNSKNQIPRIQLASCTQTTLLMSVNSDYNCLSKSKLITLNFYLFPSEANALHP